MSYCVWKLFLIRVSVYAMNSYQSSFPEELDNSLDNSLRDLIPMRVPFLRHPSKSFTFPNYFKRDPDLDPDQNSFLIPFCSLVDRFLKENKPFSSSFLQFLLKLPIQFLHKQRWELWLTFKPVQCTFRNYSMKFLYFN